MFLVPDLRAFLLELVDAELELRLLFLDPAKVFLEERVLGLHAALLSLQLRALLRGGHGGTLGVRVRRGSLRRELVSHRRRGSLRRADGGVHLSHELRL